MHLLCIYNSLYHQQMQDKLPAYPQQYRQTPESQQQAKIATQKCVQSQKNASSIFGSTDKHLLLFAYKKHKDQNSPEQIMILQQPKKKIKQQSEDQDLSSMMRNFSLQPKLQEKFFLKKVDPLHRKQLTQEIKHMLSVSHELSMQDRLERRREIFQSSKARRKFDYASEQVLAKRIIKVVNMDSLMSGGSIRGVVQLGGKSVQYEDLSLGQNCQEYYTLIKKKVRCDEKYPQIQLERQQLLREISYEPEEPTKQYDLYGDEYDSNDSDNPNYDYPDEEESDRSSEGIIARNYDSDYDAEPQYQEDEEELYQRYLRRLRKKQMEMEIQPQLQDYD